MAKIKPFHPCNCRGYNGGQCYNCLNGAHRMCGCAKKCTKANSKTLGVRLIIRTPKPAAVCRA